MRRRWSISSITSILLVLAVIAGGCSGTDRAGDTRPGSTEREGRQSSTTTPLASSTTTQAVASTSGVTGVGGGGDIGVIGCSNTAQHVDGYLAASQLDRLIPMPLGGGDLIAWGDPSSAGYASYWQELSDHVVPGTVDAIWVQLCIRGRAPEMTADEQAALAHVLDRLRTQYGDLPIYVSGINLYEEGYVCRKTGEFGVAVAWDLVDWAIENHGVIEGPMTGPLGPGTVDDDGCHLSPAGEELVGAQLVAWFDG